MSWLQRLCKQEPELTEPPQDVLPGNQAVKKSTPLDSNMTPGLTGEYDRNLREKAGMHEPPVLPEHMGLQGEFDEQGLSKRVAQAFDQTPELRSIETVEITQHGGTVALVGTVSNMGILEEMVRVASAVDGTRAVDCKQLRVQR